MRRVGRIRVKLAERLNAQFNIEIDPESMWVQNPSFARWDLARWGVQIKFPDGRSRNLHSWDTMTDVLKAKIIGVVEDDGLSVEVCAD